MNDNLPLSSAELKCLMGQRGEVCHEWVCDSSLSRHSVQIHTQAGMSEVAWALATRVRWG